MANDIGTEEEAHEAGAIVCPACGAECEQQRCKVICTSERCVHRVVMNCSEF
jgi:hypothetical protein